MKKNQKLVIAATAIGIASAACGPDVQFEMEESGSPVAATPDLAASADDLILPEVAQPAGGYVVAEFEAFVDPRNGTFELHMLDEQVVLPSAEAAGLRTVDQALFCAAPVDSNGVVGTGGANSVEVITELADYGSGPALFGLHLGCAADPGNPQGAEFLYDQGNLGAFCAEVTVRSFYTTAVLNEVHSELYFAFPASGHSGYAYPLGTGAQTYGGLSDEYGLWYYGDLGPADGVLRGCTGTRPTDPNDKSAAGELNPAGNGPCDEKTRRWVFQNSDDTPFRFRGRIRSEFIEICNGRDDDCDGRTDEGANCYADGLPCLEGGDCQTEVCIGGTCGVPVVPDFVVSDVVTIGGGGTTANGYNTLELRIGAPAPMGAAQGSSNRIILGPLSDR